MSDKLTKYKTVKYEIKGLRYEIGEPVNMSFKPLPGDKLFKMYKEEANKVLKQKIRYEINKYLKKNNLVVHWSMGEFLPFRCSWATFETREYLDKPFDFKNKN